MEFRILGPLEVWDGGSEVSLGGPKPRALLAVLLLSANEVVSTDRLIDDVWARTRSSVARRGQILCSYRIDNRLRHIAGYGPREASLGIGVHDGRIDYLSFPWLNVSFPGWVPGEGDCSSSGSRPSILKPAGRCAAARSFGRWGRS